MCGRGPSTWATIRSLPRHTLDWKRGVASTQTRHPEWGAFISRTTTSVSTDFWKPPQGGDTLGNSHQGGVEGQRKGRNPGVGAADRMEGSRATSRGQPRSSMERCVCGSIHAITMATPPDQTRAKPTPLQAFLLWTWNSPRTLYVEAHWTPSQLGKPSWANQYSCPKLTGHN